MKILCIGDSLALPGHSNSFEDTWFCKLQLLYRDFFFISFFKRSVTTEILVTEGGGDYSQPNRGADCLEFYMPNVVILQLGIVDCAPRLLMRKNLFNKVLQKMPSSFQRIFFGALKKIKKRSAKNADVSPEEFFNNLNNYLRRCVNNGVKKVIIIKICTPDEIMQKKSPQMLMSVKLYNKIYDQLSQSFGIISIVDPLAPNKKKIFEDGYHPNPIGNDLVFSALKREIDNV